MILQSQLFQGDPKLEAAAISDPAHILPGAWGPHVGKIQMALIQLDGANIAEYELQRQAYGASTAAAVLAYKRKRNIINFSYQTKADDIVGKMTIAALDREMKEREVVPSGRCRIVPIFPRPSYSLPQSAWRLRLGFKIPLGALPPLDLSPHATITPSILELRPNQVGLFRVENGKGKELRCFDPTIALIKDNQPDRIPITEDQQDFQVLPQSVGRTVIFVTAKRLMPHPEALLMVIVVAIVPVAFHFLDGPPGIKTTRTEGDVDDLLRTMNDIYHENHSGLTFGFPFVNPNLQVPGLGSDGVRVSDEKPDTPDFASIRSKFNSSRLFNVFFVHHFIDFDDPTKRSFMRAQTTRPPTGPKPLRCCICRDPQQHDPPDFDWGETLAHEAGHALAEPDDVNDPHLLMYKFGDVRIDTKIPFPMADRMLSSFRQFPP